MVGTNETVFDVQVLVLHGCLQLEQGSTVYKTCTDNNITSAHITYTNQKDTERIKKIDMMAPLTPLINN